MNFLELLQCPITGNELCIIESKNFHKYNITFDDKKFGNLEQGLIDKSGTFFYPIFDNIIILLQAYAYHIGKASDIRCKMSFDKKRVFDYYSEISFKTKDAFKIYEDSNKWVDFRPLTDTYIRNSFRKAARYYPKNGEFLLDIASGPIGLKEYIELSNGYEYRICVDISVNALIQAKINLEKEHKKGIYICGDITKIPLKDNSCDVVLCQHTLYHVPKNEQLLAVNEMYRVAKTNSKIVIVYSWFYYSWLMNICLNLVQIYRISRHFLGKIYVRIFDSKPRLYFYVHKPKWFKKSFSFSKDLEIFCWRCTNKYFLKIFVHKWLFGSYILNRLIKIEDKYSKLLGILGEYPVIVITKE